MSNASDKLLVPPAAPIREHQLDFTGQASRTKQSFAAEVNINSIVAKYNRTGQLPMGMSDVTPNYGDVSAVQSLHDALNTVATANAAFAALPSHIRDACGNDPAQLLELAADPDRVEEAVALGIIEDPALVADPATRTDVPTVADPASLNAAELAAIAPEGGETPPES